MQCLSNLRDGACLRFRTVSRSIPSRHYWPVRLARPSPVGRAWTVRRAQHPAGDARTSPAGTRTRRSPSQRSRVLQAPHSPRGPACPGRTSPACKPTAERASESAHGCVEERETKAGRQNQAGALFGCFPLQVHPELLKKRLGRLLLVNAQHKMGFHSCATLRLVATAIGVWPQDETGKIGRGGSGLQASRRNCAVA